MPGQSAGCCDKEIANFSLLGLALTRTMPLLVSLLAPMGVAQVFSQLQGSVILQSAFGIGAVLLLCSVPIAPDACRSVIRDNLPARVSHFPVAGGSLVIPEKRLKAGDQLTLKLLVHVT